MTPQPHHIKLAQDMTLHPVIVNRHRTCHPNQSQYTDTGHDTPPSHSIQTQDMTPHPSQYTDTGHDTPPVTVYTGHDTLPSHSIQTQDMTPYPAKVYRHRT